MASGLVAEPRFSLRRSIAFSTLIVLGFFGALEGVLRILGVATPLDPRIVLRVMDSDITLPFVRPDPDLFWSPQPGFRGEFQGRPLSINSLGLRGPELERPKRLGSKRVLCFGDSITFGYGVGDQQTYPHRLGLLLEERGVEVVNAGVTGYTSHQVLGLVRRLVPVAQADVATICIGWNDGNRRAVDDREWERRLRMLTAVEGRLDRLYLYRGMKALYLRTALRRESEQERTTHRVSPAHYRENLAAIVSACRRAGVRPVFVSLPRRRRPDAPWPPPSPFPAALLEAGRELDVPLLDVGDLGLGTVLPSNEEFFLDVLHLTPEGNARLAGELARQLLALGIL